MEKNMFYKTVWEGVASELKTRILTGKINQGDRIKEAEIAEEFGISRGPVREAFRNLEQEGLIEYSSRKGCTVKTVSATDSAELYLLRANLEILAIKMVNGVFKDETIEKLYEISDKMHLYQNAEDLLDIVNLDQEFHELIVKECGMSKLYEMWKTLDNSNVIIFYALYHSPYSPREMLSSNHRIIVDALKTGDIRESSKILQDHYLIVAENLYRTENQEVDFRKKDILL